MKYSIRDLSLVTVIVALVLGWLSDHWRLGHAVNRAQEDASTWEVLFHSSSQAWQDLVAELEKFDLEVGVDGVKRKSLPTSQAPYPTPPKP